MSERMPVEAIERATQLQNEWKTLDEIREKLIEEGHGEWTISTISKRIRHKDDKTHRVMLSPEQEETLKQRAGSVGAGIREAINKYDRSFRVPDDPEVERGLEVLKGAANDEHILYSNALLALRKEFGTDANLEAILRKCVMSGYMVRHGLGYKISDERFVRGWEALLG